MLAPTLAVLLLGLPAGPALLTGCPAPEAVAAELQRLGTTAAVAAVGTPEVTVEGTRMQVALRDHRGALSGARVVTAPTSCSARARVAAVLISAWAGAWSAGSFPEPPRPQPLSEPMPGPAGASGPIATIASPGGMHLNEAQISELRSAGASLDAKDTEMADRLARKGFSGDDFVAAYREYNTLKTKHPELASTGRDVVETIAIMRKLGLSEEDEYWVVGGGHPQTRALTRVHDGQAPSGRGMVKFGSATTGVGIVLLVVGLALSSDVTYETGRGNVTSGWGYAGRAMAVTGGVGIAAGLAVGILGLYRWTTPRADDAQGVQTGPKTQSLRPSGLEPRKINMRWALSPSLGPGHFGLGLAAAF